MMGSKGNTGMEGIKGGVGDKVMNHLCFADPGFLVGGGANPQGGGANIQICQIFLKNCMKFWSMGVGGTHRGRPLGSATERCDEYSFIAL